MKMLGQDVHTQEEFDAFHKGEFAALADQVKHTDEYAEDIDKEVAVTTKLAYVAIILSMVNLALTIIQHLI